MDSLTAKLQENAVHNAARTTLGTIEATMSRVIDIENPYYITEAPSVPHLAILQNIEYNADTNQWRVLYKTMRTDPSSSINQYTRVLYATREGGALTGDTGNECLRSGITSADCLNALKAAYIVADDVLPTQDSLDLQDSELASNPVSVFLSAVPYSLEQNVELIIPHEAIYNKLGSRVVTTHPVDGERVEWHFGIGMLFLNTLNNVIMFDNFHLVEMSNQMISFAKDNSYAVAQHVSFWTSQVKNRADIHVATLEMTLDSAHVLHRLDVTVNKQDIRAQCVDMQSRIYAMNESACLTRYRLCEPVVYLATDGSQQSWVTIVVPVFNVALHEEVNIDMLLFTNTTGSAVTETHLSTLSFSTRQPPQEVCSDVTLTSFDPVSFTVAELYRGTAVVAETVSGYFSVQNSSEASVSMAESLLTLVIRPRGDVSATQYFDAFPEERISLDDVYMSHSTIAGVLPSTVNNELHSVDQGRASLELDSALLSVCPMEALGAGFAWEAGFGQTPPADCATTHDWGVQGGQMRPFSSSTGPFFVYEVTSDMAAAVSWLKTTLLGESPTADAAALSIYTRAMSRVPAESTMHSKGYWIWPVYYWPDRSPVGLKDRTIVSLAWSLTRQSAPPARRLLAASSLASSLRRPLVRPVFSVHTNKILKRFPSQQKLIDRKALAQKRLKRKLPHKSV